MVRHRRRFRRLVSEQLERRLLLTADLSGLSAGAISQIDWQGLSVDAYQNRWIVNFDASEAGRSFASLVAETAPAGWSVTTLGEGFYSLATPGSDVDHVAGWTGDAPGVVYVEPDFVVTPTIAPDDPSFSQLWGLSNTGQSGGVVDADIDAPEAWSITTGSRSVVLAVVDSGVDVNHPDLAANIWRNPGEIAGNGIDDDGNGFVDDVSGWDFVSNDNTPQDGNGHGTHVAGTIGAVGGNGRGVVGVNWEVSILPLRFLDDAGSGSTAAAIAAINYATALRNAGVNVVASNHSWGGGGYSTSLRTAISRHNDAGIMFIAAAGNEATNNDAIPSYPASYDLPNVLSVAAIDRSDRLASFSNYGRTSVDLGAPGVSIYSTTPGNGYSTYSGTSMAAPHVTGVVGLLAAANPQATVSELRAAILDTVVPVAALGSGKTVTGGRLNAAAALERISPADGPRVLSVSPSGEVAPPVTDVRVVFSEEILLASLVPANFQLVAAGTDRQFGTADDVAVPIAPSAIVQSPAGAITVAVGAGLADGAYRLTLVGTGANPLRNAAGVPLLGGQDATANFTVSTPPPAPLEPNDTLATATVGLPAGMAESGFAGVVGDGVNGARDVDLFAVTLAAGESLDVVVIAQSAGSTLDSYLRVFDAAGVQLAANDDFGGSFDSGLAYTASLTGTYYVGVSGYGNTTYAPGSGAGTAAGSTGPYTVTFRRTAPPLEPNDSIAQATPVVPTAGSATFTAVVGDGAYGARDVDLFTVDLLATQQLTLAVVAAAAGSSLDSYLRVFDSAGRQLATNDDSSGSTDSSLIFTAPLAGRYVVGVSGYGNASYAAGSPGSGTAGSTGSYRLDLTLSEVTPPEPPPENPGEPNDTLATATVGLAAGGRSVDLAGTIGDGTHGAADVDLFSVVLAAGDVLEAAVRAQAIGSSLDSYLRLFDAAGTQLAANDDFGGSLDSSLSFTATVAGTYYVGVSGYGNARYSPVTGEGVVAGPVGEFELLLRRTALTPVGPLEPNDSLGQATLVSLVDGQAEVTGMVGDGDHDRRDVDLFAVSLASGETLIVDVSARDSGSTLDSYLRLFTAAGEQLAANDDFGGSVDSRLEFVASEAGTYYVGLSGFRNSRYAPLTAGSGTPGSIGSYSLGFTVVGVETPPPVEPGDTLATAVVGLTAVAPDTASFAGVIGDGTAGTGDIDCYSVVLDASQSLTATIRARADGSTLDSYLRLFDAAGNQVAANDDFGGSQDSLLSYTAPAPGTYFLGVSGFGNSSYLPLTGGNVRTGSTGEYTLSLTRTTPPFEQNDSIAQATPVALVGGVARLEAVVGDGVYAARDVDIFAISLSAGQAVTLDVTARDVGSTLDSYLRLFDAAGRQIAVNDDAAGSRDSYLQFTALSAGVYYVGVSGFRNSLYFPAVPGSGVSGSTGTYRLDISVVGGAAASDRGSLFAAVAASAAGRPASNADLFRLIALLSASQSGAS
jgi:subtilisin family serine protease